MQAPNFLETWSLADSLAKAFVGHYPTPVTQQHSSLNARFRNDVVMGIRWLWRNSGPDGRTTIAARIAVWRGRESAQVSALTKAIGDRERRRGNDQLPHGSKPHIDL